MSLTSSEFQNIKIVTSFVISEYNEASVFQSLETPSSGFFINPSNVLGRSSITGHILNSVNQFGKLQFSDPVGYLSLNDLSDVIITNPQLNQYLTYNGTDWTNQNFNLEDLTDVTIVGLTQGDYLVYDGADWINKKPDVSLDDLSDVIITAPALNEVLIYDGSDWVNQPLGAFSLVNLCNVNISGPAANELLVYDGTEWVNGGLLLNDMFDVIITAPVNGQVIQYNGSEWVNQNYVLSLDEITDVTISNPLSGELLLFDGAEWINQEITLTLGQVNDVTFIAPISGDFFRNDGVVWEEATFLYTLSLLLDVSVGVPTVNEILVYDGIAWDDQDPDLFRFTDVVLTGVAANEYLVYDGTNWVNQDLNQDSVGALGDVQLSAGGGAFTNVSGGFTLNYSEVGLISTLDVGTEGGTFSISATDATTAATQGGSVSIISGSGNTSGAGGSMTLAGGIAGPTNGDGGSVNLTGQDINLTSGQFTSTLVDPGKINLMGGVNETISNDPVQLATTAATFDYHGFCLKGSYVYIVQDEELSIYDITTPDSLSLVGNLTDPVNLANAIGIIVIGIYAYITTSTGNRFTIINVSDESSPVLSGSVTSSFLNFSPRFDFYGSYAIIPSNVNNSVASVDVSDPTAPEVISDITDATNLNGAYTVKINNNIAYVSAEGGNRITSLDISDPFNITVISSLLDGTNLLNASGLSIQSNYLYVGTLGTRVTTVDISDPTSMSVLGSVSNVNLTNTRYSGIIAYGDYVYQLSDTGVLNIIDVFDPTSPTILSSLSSLDISRDIIIQGNYLYGIGNAFQSYDLHGCILNPLETSNLYTNKLSTKTITTSGSVVFNSGLSIGGNLSVIGMNGPMISFRAEKLTNAAATTYYSWGNGSNNNAIGVVVPFPCKMVYIGLHVESLSTCTLTVFVNGVSTGQGLSLSASTNGYNNIDINLDKNDYFNVAVTAGTTINASVCTMYITAK